ncbi:tRNA 2-selenouridine(34) synthase MnmH [Acetivibrio cellulolyticus]|uniref:tRNA 2-selenouridine(34) synthase MnmH n=1 Tax=Acetivibrio cellulolyticus TaxID=35830 RepID=UPI0001E30193|nr:tRNA 2-selenouridine(34) synthase MnmH [Acetivibrio cellulolyticus]
MIDKTSSDFERIVIEGIPLIDVRAPIEYEKGAFINSVNLPIMDDEERRLVGICYKEKGNEEAVKLGHKLVSGEVKQARIDAWSSFVEKNPDCMLYCFRGGQRSAISQEWLYERTGKVITRLEGGYKAFRNYLINSLEPSEQNAIPVLLGGYTGSSKTKLLKMLENSVDLEGLANHRGSTFGRYITPQPTQIDFENNLAYVMIHHKHKSYKHIILEDEGSNVGRCYIPKPLHGFFSSGDYVLIDLPVEERVQNTVNEYVVQSQADYVKTFGEEQGLKEWFGYISSSIERIKKRLGGDRYKLIMDSFEQAFKEQMTSGSYHHHEGWIELLLKEYYDPMYYHQIQNSTRKILFRGNYEDTWEYLKTLNQIRV